MRAMSLQSPDLSIVVDSTRAGYIAARPRVLRNGLRLLWWLCAPLAIALSVAGIPARLRDIPIIGVPTSTDYYIFALEIVLASVYFVTGLLIVRRRTHEPLVVFLSLTLVMVGATETGMTDALIQPAYSSVAWLWHWPVLLMRALEMIGVLLILYLYPNGRFVPRFTRWLALAWIVLTLAWLVFPNLPLNTIYGPTWRRTPLLAFANALLWFSTGIAAQIYRYRREAGYVERQQTEWMAAGLIAAVLGGLAFYGISAINASLWPGFLGIAYTWLRPTLQTLLMALLPLCIGIAILRYNLFDIEMLISGTLLYGALTTIVIALYVIIVGALSQIAQERASLSISLLATGVVAVLFQPLRERLHRAINRLVYGERDDPYAVLTRLGRQWEENKHSPDALLAAVAQTVAKSLRLPYAAVLLLEETPDDNLVGVFGQPPPSGQLFSLPLLYQDEPLGQLIVAQRAPSELFSPGDRRLLDDLARQAAIAVYAARVGMDVQLSRNAIVSAREEERRRLRRDLHDGLGPALAGLSFRIDAARNLLARDPQRADEQLNAAGNQLQDAIADIRRLVYNLRPPALDELGLVAALRQHFTMLQLTGVQLTLDAPESLPPLPAAVEVAAYRIVQEAANNALRHAGAHHCHARISLDEGALCVSVRDDGNGMQPAANAGVGTLAMRERAAELGGTLEIADQPGGGLAVTARLPLSAP